MGDKNLTLFALHTHGDTQFGPSSVPGVDAGSDEPDEESAVELSEDEESGGGGGLGALLIALVVLAGIAMVAKKLTGDDESVDLAESDEL